MKIGKIGMLLLILSLVLGACDDDEKNELDNGGLTSTKADLSATNFGYEAKTVLKNAGRIEIPVLLDKKAATAVKVTVGIKGSSAENAAREGMDFNIEEKVVNIPVGDTIGFVKVDILDNRETDADREFTVEITGVFGGGKAATDKQNCRISIVSNSFVEFEKSEWETWEAAATETAPEDHKQTRFVPLVITGEITEPSTFVLQAVDNTAKEYYHFTIVSKEITVNPGDTRVMVELLPKDDSEANKDRIFQLALKYVKGGNLTLGKNNLNCQVTIISEEVLKTASFEMTSFAVKEGETLRIPVVLDHAPQVGEEAVIVTVKPIDGVGNAIADMNFVIKNPNLTFEPGQSMVELEIETKDDADLFERELSLEIRSAIGAEFVAEPCKVIIENDDFPSFKSGSYSSLEGSGENFIPVCIPTALNYDVTLKIQAEAQTAEEGVDYKLLSNEILIKEGTTEGKLYYNVGGKPEWQETPVFNIKIVGVDNYSMKGDIATKITIKKNEVYRNLLGTWAISAKDNKENKNYNSVFSAGQTEEEILKNWGNKILCTNFTNYSSWTLRLDVIGDKVFIAPDICGQYDGGDVFPSYSTNGNNYDRVSSKVVEIEVESANKLKLQTNVWLGGEGPYQGGRATYNAAKEFVWTKK